MSQSNKKITNQDLMNLLTKKFEDMNKDIVDMKKDIDKRFDKIENDIYKINLKINLIIACPIIQSEIDHGVLKKINAS